jgi:hypothetical protein
MVRAAELTLFSTSPTATINNPTESHMDPDNCVSSFALTCLALRLALWSALTSEVIAPKFGRIEGATHYNKAGRRIVSLGSARIGFGPSSETFVRASGKSTLTLETKKTVSEALSFFYLGRDCKGVQEQRLPNKNVCFDGFLQLRPKAISSLSPMTNMQDSSISSFVTPAQEAEKNRPNQNECYPDFIRR